MTDKEFVDELRKWWSFDDRQVHTHSWHSREDFIEKQLPRLLDRVRHLPPINEPSEVTIRRMRSEEWPERT